MKAIISGASRGIGKACAIHLAKEGYDLCLISRKLADLEDLKSKIIAESKVEIDLLPLDLTDLEAIDKVEWEVILNDDQQLLLINNLGTYKNDAASEIATSEVDEFMRFNLYSAIRLSEHIIPSMKKAAKGLIVNIVSINGLAADHHAASYSISKHALKAWNDALREELRTTGIKVTSFYPGPVNTSSWDGISVDHQAMIQADDVAEMIVTIGKLSDSALVEEVRINPLHFNPS